MKWFITVKPLNLYDDFMGEDVLVEAGSRCYLSTPNESQVQEIRDGVGKNCELVCVRVGGVSRLVESNCIMKADEHEDRRKKLWKKKILR